MNNTFSSIFSLRLGRLSQLFANLHRKNIARFFSEAFILSAELLYIGEIYTLLNRIFKPNMRRLTERERALARTIFGASLDYDRIWLDSKARIGCKKGDFAYVSFYIINAWGDITESHFIHELVHVWQYERLGARYMLWAVQAQGSGEGYNYGGLSALLRHPKSGLRAFNMEQQADIVTDYFRIKQGYKAQWSEATKADLYAYEPYMDEIRGEKRI